MSCQERLLELRSQLQGNAIPLLSSNIKPQVVHGAEATASLPGGDRGPSVCQESSNEATTLKAASCPRLECGVPQPSKPQRFEARSGCLTPRSKVDFWFKPFFLDSLRRSDCQAGTRTALYGAQEPQIRFCKGFNQAEGTSQFPGNQLQLLGSLRSQLPRNSAQLPSV